MLYQINLKVESNSNSISRGDFCHTRVAAHLGKLQLVTSGF